MLKVENALPFNELIWQESIESKPSQTVRISHNFSNKRPALFASHGKSAEANLPFASLGFFYHKMVHILPTKVRNEQREQHFI